MPRPFKTDRPIKLTISLPESLHTRLSLLLFSTADGRVPLGAWSTFFETLGRQALARLPAQPPQE